jgi:hypothetical protein
MSQVKETTLLEYVIAYLQEELKRWDSHLDLEDSANMITSLVDDAIEAYEGDAR